MRVLLTGATGYIGQHVAAQLHSQGHEVVGVIRSPRGAPSWMETVVGDLCAPASILDAAASADGVVLTAFPSHGATWAESVATEAAFHRALRSRLRGLGTRVVCSNGSIFLGDSGDGRHDESAPVDTKHPAAIRAAASRALLDGAAEGFVPVELRIASFVYGAGGSIFVPALLAAARRDGESIYVGDGSTRLSTVSVTSAARAYTCALGKGVAGAHYHIAADEAPTTADLARAIGASIGVPTRSASFEEAQERLDPFTALFLATSNRLDNRRARRELGWEPGPEPGLLWDVAFGSYSR
ncbi:MAG: NAD-dependent epimerase/dehydratase family protein [Myxococcota bacterium]